MTRSIVHPRALAHLTASFFPHSVAFQTEASTQDASGQDIPGGWSTVAGFAQVPCRIAPISTAQERKLAEFVVTGADVVILIVGAYDDVLTTGMRLVNVDGTEYDVLAVEVDSVHVMTRVLGRTLTPA